MKRPDISIGFGFRPFTGYRAGSVYLPRCLIRLGPNWNTCGRLELSIDFGLREGRVLEGEIPWRHSWRIRSPRAPLKLIWCREISRAVAWTGRKRRCIGFEFGWGFNRRVVYLR